MPTIMISIVPDIPGGLAISEDNDSCPLVTRDEEANEENKEAAIEEKNYREPNSSVAFRNDECCANCALYDTSKEMQECIGDDSGELGYCQGLDFVCHGENTCDMWMEQFKDNM